MKTNKQLPGFYTNKILNKLSKMTGTILMLSSDNWVEQEDGTFKNTIKVNGFTSDMTLEVDLYNDGNLTETQIEQYDNYITEFDVNDGEIVATAATRPTQDINILCRGEFAIDEVQISVSGGESSSGNGNVVNNLESTSTNSSLSANQGRLLNEKILSMLSTIEAYEERILALEDVVLTAPTVLTGSYNVTVGPKAGNSKTIEVTFAKPFLAPPNVVLTSVTSQYGYGHSAVIVSSSVTKTGFSFTATVDWLVNDGTVTVNWKATAV